MPAAFGVKRQQHHISLNIPPHPTPQFWFVGSGGQHACTFCGSDMLCCLQPGILPLPAVVLFLLFSHIPIWFLILSLLYLPWFTAVYSRLTPGFPFVHSIYSTTATWWFRYFWMFARTLPARTVITFASPNNAFLPTDFYRLRGSLKTSTRSMPLPGCARALVPFYGQNAFPLPLPLPPF